MIAVIVFFGFALGIPAMALLLWWMGPELAVVTLLAIVAFAWRTR